MIGHISSHTKTIHSPGDDVLDEFDLSSVFFVTVPSSPASPVGAWVPSSSPVRYFQGFQMDLTIFVNT